LFADASAARDSTVESSGALPPSPHPANINISPLDARLSRLTIEALHEVTRPTVSFTDVSSMRRLLRADITVSPFRK
jgi:hypothetical protein